MSDSKTPQKDEDPGKDGALEVAMQIVVRHRGGAKLSREEIHRLPRSTRGQLFKAIQREGIMVLGVQPDHAAMVSAENAAEYCEFLRRTLEEHAESQGETAGGLMLATLGDVQAVDKTRART